MLADVAHRRGGCRELWKLNHYYERLDEWNAAQGIAPNPFLGPAAESDWELHNLTVDPEERHNRAFDDPASVSSMKSVLETERDAKRRIPTLAERHQLDSVCSSRRPSCLWLIRSPP